jgi:hypothetical protein
MDLLDVASYFDEDEIFDAYTGQFLFYAHTRPHDDHTSSGATVRRRTMTAAPGTAPPARRAIRWYDTYWVVGNNNADAFRGEQLRRSYGLKKSTGLLALLTPGQACASGAGLQFHAHREYFRDMTDAKTSADWDTMWNVFCPLVEPVVKGAFLRDSSNKLLRVRNVYPSVDEFLVAEADQLDDDALQPAVFTTAGVLDLVNDTLATASFATPVVQTDPQKCYEFRTAAESVLQPGDRAVFTFYLPKVGDVFTMQGANWRVLTVQPSGDAWLCLARRT